MESGLLQHRLACCCVPESRRHSYWLNPASQEFRKSMDPSCSFQGTQAKGQEHGRRCQCMQLWHQSVMLVLLIQCQGRERCSRK